MSKIDWNKPEEVKAYKKQKNAERYQKNKEQILKHRQQYYQANKEQIIKQQGIYYQTHKEERTKYNIDYYQANKGKISEHQTEYYQDNKENISKRRREKRKLFNEEEKEKDKRNYYRNREQKLEHKRQYQATPFGRASNLLQSYRRSDKQQNRGECTLVAQWIVDNIFSKPCCYCGETDWHKIGCDRIDNDLPHTPDNVVPSCRECNKKRGTMEFNQFIKSIKK